MTSIIIDTCVMRLYDTPKDPVYLELFRWLHEEGTLITSQLLIKEYIGTGNRNITVLLGHLSKNANNIRHIKISNKILNEFNKDKNFQYTCNLEDREHAKLVFISTRKKLISQDNKLINDINKFKKVDKIKPEAQKHPDRSFYAL